MPVSAILAVCNGAAYLAEAIDSMLGQAPAPAELIVVDDGSTDATPDILARYGRAIRVIRQSNRGQAAALVTGIGASRHPLLAFNDADDVWTPGRLALQSDALQSDAGLDAVFGMAEQFVSPELDTEVQARLRPRSARLTAEVATGMLARRAAFERIGSFNPALSAAYYYDWLARFKAAGLRSRILPEVVLRRRLHPNNFGRLHARERDRQLLGALHRRIRTRRDGER